MKHVQNMQIKNNNIWKIIKAVKSRAFSYDSSDHRTYHWMINEINV